MQLLTRAQMRERIRRDRLGIVTPKEMNLATAADGDAPTYQPDPSNNQINAAIEEALAELNSDVFFSGSNGLISVSIGAQTGTGTYRYGLTGAIGGYTGSGQINNIRHAHWTPAGTGTSAIMLEAKTFRELDRDRPDWPNTPVGMPEIYLIESYDLHLFPSPSTAGTLSLQAGLSMLSPLDDTDTVGQLPADFTPVLLDMATVRLLPNLIGDAEMIGRAKLLIPRAEAGKQRMKVWYLTQMQDRQAGITHRRHRPQFTGRRR